MPKATSRPSLSEAKQIVRRRHVGATSDIDRKMASKLLGVSIRTVDRYIRSGQLPAREQRGRIWLTKRDIMEFRRDEAIPARTTMDRPPFAAAQNASFYQDLYEEAKRTLTEYQQKLEQANYRIGQLESHSVHPTASLKPIERKEDFSPNDFFRRELADREKEIVALKELAKKEKTSRIIFAILTYLLLILQPVFWYFLR